MRQGLVVGSVELAVLLAASLALRLVGAGGRAALVAGGVNALLGLEDHSADGALLALGQAVLRTGGVLAGNDLGCVIIVDGHGNGRGVAGLVGSNNLLLPGGRSQGKGTVVIELDLGTVHGHRGKVLIGHGDLLRGAVGLAVLDARDHGSIGIGDPLGVDGRGLGHPRREVVLLGICLVGIPTGKNIPGLAGIVRARRTGFARNGLRCDLAAAIGVKSYGIANVQGEVGDVDAIAAVVVIRDVLCSVANFQLTVYDTACTIGDVPAINPARIKASRQLGQIKAVICIYTNEVGVVTAVEKRILHIRIIRQIQRRELVVVAVQLVKLLVVPKVELCKRVIGARKHFKRKILADIKRSERVAVTVQPRKQGAIRDRKRRQLVVFAGDSRQFGVSTQVKRSKSVLIAIQSIKLLVVRKV